MTVLKVELADIAFALDSMLAAVALAVTLPELGDFHIGGINGGQFTVMLLGGIIGLIIMRFAARQFVVLLEKFPTLETAAFLIVGWVGVKLVVLTLAHPALQILDTELSTFNSLENDILDCPCGNRSRRLSIWRSPTPEKPEIRFRIIADSVKIAVGFCCFRTYKFVYDG